MSKISGYANSVSALGTDDLIDVSEKISSSPDVYESRKMTGATLATFIQSYAANIISTNGLTMTANRTHDLGSYVLTFQNAGFAIEGAQTIKAASAVADMFNLYDSTSALLSRFNSTYISLWATSQIASEVFGVTGHTILKGVDTAGTSKVLDLYDNDTVPTSLWSFRNNGDVYLGKDSTCFLNNTLTFNGGSGAIFKLYSTLRTDDIFQVFFNGGGEWLAKNGTIDIGAGTTYSNYYTRFTETGIKSYGAGSVVHEINNVTGKVYFMNGYMSGQDFIVGSNAVIGSEQISLQGDTLVGATSDKVGFMGTAPIVQVTTAVAAATFTANTSGIADDTATFDGYTIGQVIKALRNYGLLA